MPIVTLTTDFGTADYQIGALKGALLSAMPNLNLVDISHNIAPYNIVQGAFVFRNVWNNFPERTIHCLSINDLPDHPIPFIALEHEGHFFIGPDNGLLHLVFGRYNSSVYRLPKPVSGVFGQKAILARACAHLASGQSIETIGEPSDGLVERISFQPVLNKDNIRGSIIFVDRYGNAITNITREIFDQVAKGRSFALYFRRHDPLRLLSKHYSDIPVGEPLCLFNAIGHLELAIHLGNASSLLGLHVGDAIQIDFIA